MTSLRALVGHPVVATDSAEQLGTVDGLVVDPVQHRVVALRLSRKSSPFLSWGDVRSIGADAVMVTTAAAAREARGPLEERVADGVALATGRRLLDDGGDELGALDDLEFDDTTGALAHLDVGDTTIAGDRLTGIGSYAVVVRRADIA